MKAKLILIAFVAFAILSVTSYSYAITLNPSSGPYMADNDSTIPTESQSIFYWDEIPYSFAQFNISDLNRKLDLGWTWKYNNIVMWDSAETILKTDMSGTHYNSFKTPDNWNSLKEGRIGDWSVYLEWGTFNQVSDNRTMNFTLNSGLEPTPTPATVPEPASSTLLLTGITALTAIHIRKKKKTL